MFPHILSSLSSKISGELIFDVYKLSNGEDYIIYITSISTEISPYYIEKIYGEKVNGNNNGNDNNIKIDKIKRIYAWELRKFINNQNMIFIDMHKSFARFFNDGVLVPYRVSEVLDIDLPKDMMIRHKNQRLKKAYKYNHDIKNDIESLKFFYEKMHIPHVKTRYGNNAHIESFRIFEKMLKKGDLILIKLNGQYVAGALCEINGSICDIKKFGVIDENFGKDGAIVAAYYFSILNAKEKNLKMVDFGGSKPFLLDGVLRHKISWGAKICEDKTNKRVIYMKNISFKQPFIYIEDKKLKSIISPEYNKLAKEYERAGLDLIIKD